MILLLESSLKNMYSSSMFPLWEDENGDSMISETISFFYSPKIMK
jgi:hypothetical protein